jgi:subtilisin family serine protease
MALAPASGTVRFRSIDKTGLSQLPAKFTSDLNERLDKANPEERIRIVVELNEPAGEGLKSFLDISGGTIGRRFRNLNCAAVEAPAETIKQISDLGEVGFASLDSSVATLGDTPGHVVTTTGAAAAAESERSDDGDLDGSGIGVAVIDSGIDSNHRAFRNGTDVSRTMVSVDFTGEHRTDDPYGHGTFVASLIAGSLVPYGGQYAGIAPGARLINLRALNSQGLGTVSTVMAALDWVMANHSRYNIRVVNLSIGTAAIQSFLNSPLCHSVRKLVDAGIVAVAAAGNDGKDSAGNKIYGAVHCPGNEPSALTVGASNTFGTDARDDDVVTTYSSRGPTRSFFTDAVGVKHYDNVIKPEIVAPGNKIIGAEAAHNQLVTSFLALDTGLSQGEDSRMMYLSGTSVSAAITSGGVALLLQANPRLTPNLVKALLMYTAQPLAGFNMLEQGTGELNIAGGAGLAELVRPDISSNLPLGAFLLTTRFAPQPRTTIAGFSFPWSGEIILQNTFATGANLILKYQKVYNAGALLGDGVALSDGVAVADLTMLTAGVAIADSLSVSDGGADGSGTFFLSIGVLLSDGVALTDGVALGDGLLTSDSTLLADGRLVDGAIELQIVVTGDNTAFMK